MYSVIANMEILLMCIIMVAVLFFFNLRYWKPRILNPLSAIYILVMIGCVLEMIAFWVDGKAELAWLNRLSNMLYLSSIGIIGACMLGYCNKQFPKPIWKGRVQHVLWMLPVIFELVVLISAPKTELIFYVTPDGCYHRADTFFLQLIPYGYLLVATIYGIYWFVRSETTKERNQYLAIAGFSVPPFFLGGTQLLIKANTLDILEFSIVLSLLANFAVSQNNRITRDSLTRLPNREVLDTVLVEKMRIARRDRDQKLYVMMCDLDGFKQINDTYGHPEGDRALVLAADTIYEVTARYKATAARVGGDEFAVVLQTEDDSLAGRLMKEIEERLLQASEDCKYALRMSIGCTQFRSSDTISDILRSADRELYQVKRGRKVHK